MRLAVPALCLLLVAPLAQAEPDPDHAETTVSSHGGLVQLPGGVAVGLLPGSARKGAGWHMLRLDRAEPLMPPSEGVGPRPIDRRASSPLGMVEGPAVSVGSGFRIQLAAPDPTGSVATGMVDAEQWNAWLSSVPERVMPYVEPHREGQREGLLVAVPHAGPDGSAEEVDVWLRSPGGIRRLGETDRVGAPRPGEEGIRSWDPCLVIGRLDAEGTAWFYLPQTSCGLDEAPVWTPLREQSQEEFATWVEEQTPPRELKAVRKELKALAKDELKREKDSE